MPNFFAKHFSQIARVLGYSNLEDDALATVIEALGDLFRLDNPRFDFGRFRRAVERARAERDEHERMLYE